MLSYSGSNRESKRRLLQSGSFNYCSRKDYLDLNVIDIKKKYMTINMEETAFISLNFMQRQKAPSHILSQPFITVP